MSESEGDLSDQLLELAGASEKKRKRSSKSSSSKRRKALASDTDDPESEEEDVNPFPLEGKFINEEDRQRLMGLGEMERESIIAGRMEDQQRIQDKRGLDRMLEAQKDPESVSKAAKRSHTARGSTKEKTRQLDALKAKRKAKDEKKRVKQSSPKADRSSSPMDMEMSTDDDEDGQISKQEQEEERENRLISKTNPEDEKVTLTDLETCRLTRESLAKHCLAPWFEEYVKGAWVRFLIGNDDSGNPVYRLCEVNNLGVDLVKPYKLDGRMFDRHLELKHGKSLKLFTMERVSNARFTETEFDHLVRIHTMDQVKMPRKSALEKKRAQILKYETQPLTENDISAMLVRKSQLHSSRPSAAHVTMERSRLVQARTLAHRRQDFAEVEEIDARIAELASSMPESSSRSESMEDALAKVNERNRKANLEAVRKAELAEAERKRRERKLAMAAGGRPAGVPADPSARLKTVPRLFESNSSSGTPIGTPKLAPTTSIPGGRSVSPLPAAAANIELSMVSSVEIDLGDF